jgi:hypothetical protein
MEPLILADDDPEILRGINHVVRSKSRSPENSAKYVFTKVRPGCNGNVKSWQEIPQMRPLQGSVPIPENPQYAGESRGFAPQNRE